jgi:hypothetical protein
MLHKFEEEFGSGQENTIAVEHLTEGSRWRVKGIPRLALMASLLDPRTKCAVGVPAADCGIV